MLHAFSASIGWHAGTLAFYTALAAVPCLVARHYLRRLRASTRRGER